MKSSRIILVVNRTPRNAALLRDFLEHRGYGAATAGSLDEIDQAIDSGCAYGLALIDVSGFDQRIWERCNLLRENGVPFLLISAPSTQAAEEAFRVGARGILTKPLAMKDFAHLIDSLMS